MLITPSGKLYVCKQCDESFDKSYSLANHVKSFCPKRVKKTDGDNADTKGEQGEAGIIRLIGSCGIPHKLQMLLDFNAVVKRRTIKKKRLEDSAVVKSDEMEAESSGSEYPIIT